MLIVDFRVLVWNITNSIDPEKILFGAKRQDISPKESLETFIKLQWIYALNRGPDWFQFPMDPSPMVICDDESPYWRSKIYPEYKKGRKPKPHEWFAVDVIGHRYLQRHNKRFALFSKPGFEADDHAGSILKIRNLLRLTHPNHWLTKHPIYLWTVDSDWIQLVDEKTTWLNTGPWEPKIRDPQRALEWAKKRLKVDIEHPQDLVFVKSQQGDPSDNLPPGVDIGLIDLINVDPAYSLLEPSYIRKVLTLNNFWSGYDPEKSLVARRFLNRNYG